MQLKKKLILLHIAQRNVTLKYISSSLHAWGVRDITLTREETKEKPIHGII